MSRKFSSWSKNTKQTFYFNSIVLVKALLRFHQTKHAGINKWRISANLPKYTIKFLCFYQSNLDYPFQKTMESEMLRLIFLDCVFSRTGDQLLWVGVLRRLSSVIIFSLTIASILTKFGMKHL